ncbi:unnamed protein product [Acanthoscelides obtectus]|uniref:Uncharacterized protein n=1 Tax=Acanthoscelides obtectus TaxID=200917 RepID=A0A9P0Q659_ACAOB|nr:unnamed protein product [Acanthoscelides obtectus]CAH2012138.1 unnamed protein product [Acanthoscelides obtectus]CAK1680395.1 hypothetical protein AOBTE_LOCUS32617 [Acanthoscelides obtectus]CAK1681555.1 hypothetical protein AOBTE_LOCUS33160 [Acanthoscelides obtectus]
MIFELNMLSHILMRQLGDRDCYYYVVSFCCPGVQCKYFWLHLLCHHFHFSHRQYIFENYR